MCHAHQLELTAPGAATRRSREIQNGEEVCAMRDTGWG
jgi:hypothetical protein